jgi:hypothetical protein
MAKSAKNRTAGRKSSANPAAHSRSKTAGEPDLTAARANSKQSRIIAMLQSPAGATVITMMKATGWQQHSVRGFLAGVVRKRLKLKLGSAMIDGTRVYRIATEGASKAAARQPARRSR